jgi:hypothetical protein
MGATRYFGRPRGRFFSVKDERRRIDRDMELYQQVHGTTVLWFFLDEHHSVQDDIYDEGFVSGGKVYDGPTTIPVLSAQSQQGQEASPGDTGFEVYDRVTLRISYEQARRAGLDPELTKYREGALHDRFVFRNRVFDVESVQTRGHFEQTAADTTVQVIGVQLRPDELVDSPSFARWSA